VPRGMPARNSVPASHGTALAVVCGVRAAKGHGRQDLSHVSWRTCVADLLTDHRTVVLRGVPS
jgi:hypothetical protein